ncbi:MAG TPA: class I SAM-dependent methyltransferase [Sphingomicrobium sp.]|nr:class I SAM-dependent methyltransferase [Sphingomicrobium sp.]
MRAGRTWDAEHRAIRQLLAYARRGSAILDSPVGTGRLFPYFDARGLDICGVDVSSDMLAKARERADSIGCHVRLEQCDIRSVPHPDDSFDLVVCLRFLNMVDANGLKLVLAELARLSRDKLLIGIRYVSPLTDVRPLPWDILRLAFRPIQFVRSLGRAWLGPRSDVVVHDKRLIVQLLQEVGMQLLDTRYVDRRWDNTDYVLWLLEKQPDARDREERLASVVNIACLPPSPNAHSPGETRNCSMRPFAPGS